MCVCVCVCVRVCVSFTDPRLLAGIQQMCTLTYTPNRSPADHRTGLGTAALASPGLAVSVKRKPQIHLTRAGAK